MPGTPVQIADGDSSVNLHAEVFGADSTLTTAGANGALRCARKGVLLYDSGTVAAGALLDSGALNTAGIQSLFIVATNADAATRNLNLLSLAADGTTTLDTWTLRAVATATEHGAVGADAVSTGTPTMQFAVAIALPPAIKIQLAAAGASNGRVIVYGR